MSLHFPADVAAEINAEAKRLGRSRSWLVQRAWRLARGELRSLPGANDEASSEEM